MGERWKMTVRTRGQWLIGELRIGGRLYRYKMNLQTLKRRLRKAYKRAGGQIEIGFSLSKAWKAVKKTAKRVTKSKVWKMAEKAANMGAALPPPYGPALAAAGAGMKTTRALVLAKKKISKGDRKGARRLVQAAKNVASRYPGMMAQSRKASGPLYLALVR